MLKPALQLAAGGVVTILLWKLALILLVPLLGFAVGLLALLLKAVLLGVILLVVWLVYRRMNRPSTTAT
ncbi:MAG: hypothetical protein AB7I33_15685 [Gemmatimonadales bacterium]